MNKLKIKRFNENFLRPLIVSNISDFTNFANLIKKIGGLNTTRLFLFEYNNEFLF